MTLTSGNWGPLLEALCHHSTDDNLNLIKKNKTRYNPTFLILHHHINLDSSGQNQSIKVLSWPTRLSVAARQVLTIRTDGPPPRTPSPTSPAQCIQLQWRRTCGGGENLYYPFTLFSSSSAPTQQDGSYRSGSRQTCECPVR